MQFGKGAVASSTSVHPKPTEETSSSLGDLELGFIMQIFSRPFLHSQSSDNGEFSSNTGGSALTLLLSTYDDDAGDLVLSDRCGCGRAWSSRARPTRPASPALAAKSFSCPAACKRRGWRTDTARRN